MLAGFVDGHDVRVPQTRGEPGFLFKSLTKLGFRPVRFCQQFYRDHAIQPPLTRLINDAHRAAAQLRLQLVFAEVPDHRTAGDRRRGSRRISRGNRRGAVQAEAGEAGWAQASRAQRAAALGTLGV